MPARDNIPRRAPHTGPGARMWACMLASVGVLASGAYAQQRSPVTIIGPVRQGYDDVGPLSRSLSQPAADLRTPMEFDRVYRVQTGVDFFGRPREMYARAAGGLTAVFPQSSYVSTRGGMEPEVPAGTVWIIGAPQDPSRMSGAMPGFQPPRGLAPGEFDGRVDMRIPMEADGRNTRPDVSRSHALADTRTIWTSEIYRQQRLTHLLDRAAGPAVRPQ